MTSVDNNFQVAAIQMVSSTSLLNNLKDAEDLIAQAADEGASLVVLPEYFCLMGQHDTDKYKIRETLGSGIIQEFLQAQARRFGIWLVGGTLPIQASDSSRTYNTCLVYNPQGQQVARYDKVHLFSFSKGDESYDESVAICPGDNAPQTFTAPCGNTGLSVCYDLRFPEFFRALGHVNLIVLPAAFTHTTGKAHWEVLLRARAIENQCYVLASAQGGHHANGRRTWGHSMLIDPWGEIVSVHEQGPGLAMGIVDHGCIAQVRESLPALKHRTM